MRILTRNYILQSREFHVKPIHAESYDPSLHAVKRNMQAIIREWYAVYLPGICEVIIPLEFFLLGPVNHKFLFFLFKERLGKFFRLKALQEFFRFRPGRILVKTKLSLQVRVVVVKTQYFPCPGIYACRRIQVFIPFFIFIIFIIYFFPETYVVNKLILFRPSLPQVYVPEHEAIVNSRLGSLFYDVFHLFFR